MNRSAAPPEVHVHISRLVVDRGTVPGTEVDGLREHVIGRIANRISDATADTTEPAWSFSIADAIADAVASRVTPHVSRAGRRS